MNTIRLSTFLTALLISLALASFNSFAVDCTDADFDNDGHDRIECGGDDCDDGDADRYPGNVELCDVTSHDEDCDYATIGIRDQDSDGFNSDICCNVDESQNEYCGDDCDDQRASTNRLALDVCDGVDNNCDGATDDETSITQFEDLDLDGHGDPDTETPRVCPGSAGYSPLANDCNDANPAIQPGNLVCDPENVRGVLYCDSDGAWVSGTSCGAEEVCFTQQNGTGICLPEKGKTTPKPPKP